MNYVNSAHEAELKADNIILKNKIIYLEKHF